MFQRNYRAYRLALLELLVKIFLPPLLLAEIILSSISLQRSWFIRFAAYPVVTTCYWFMRNTWTDKRNAREAARRGAVIIPTIVGKWPGSLDIALELDHEAQNGYAMMEFQKYFEQAGSNTVAIRLLWQDVILTRDAVHARHVVADGFRQWVKGDTTRFIMESSIGNSIINSDGEVWKAHRIMARPFFSKERVADLITIGKHADLAIDIISGATEAIDVQDLFARLTVDTTFEFIFGRQLQSLPGFTAEKNSGHSGCEDDFADFIHAIDEVQELLRDGMSRPMAVIHRRIDPILDDVFAERNVLSEKGVSVNLEEATMAHYFASNMNDRDAVRDELVTMMLAGRDTTSALLTFAVYLLAMTPQALARLKEEVQMHCGNDNPPTLASFKEMHYLRAVIDETMRLFPPVPGSQRVSAEDDILPSSRAGDPNYFVPQGTDLAWFTILTQRQEDLWGGDAEEFVPERWLDKDRARAMNACPGMYMPFSAGPRTCIGQQFALNAVSYFLARLAQAVTAIELVPSPNGTPPSEWATKPGRQAIEKCHPSVRVVIYAKGGMWLRFRTCDS